MRTRGKKMTEADRDVIRILSSKGWTVRKIADHLKRGKSGVQAQIDKMRKDGSIDQGVLDLGQADEK